MNDIKTYFSFDSEYNLEGHEVYSLLTEVSILEAEEFLYQENIDSSNIYFKLLSQVQFLEADFEKNRNEIAYVYYLMGYYLGLFLHPFDGDKIAINYINKAIEIEGNKERLKIYEETIKMIEEDL